MSPYSTSANNCVPTYHAQSEYHRIHVILVRYTRFDDHRHVFDPGGIRRRPVSRAIVIVGFGHKHHVEAVFEGGFLQNKQLRL